MSAASGPPAGVDKVLVIAKLQFGWSGVEVDGHGV